MSVNKVTPKIAHKFVAWPLLWVWSFLWFGCGGDGCQRFESPRAFVPEHATAVVAFSSPEALRSSITGFVGGLGAIDGVIAWLGGNYGINFGDSDGLEDAGIDPAMEMIAFYADEVWTFVSGVSDTNKMDGLVNQRLKVLGYPDASLDQTGEPKLKIALGDVVSGRPTVAWGFRANVLFVSWGGATVDVASSVRKWMARPPDGSGALSTAKFQALWASLPNAPVSTTVMVDLAPWVKQEDQVDAWVKPLGYVAGAAKEVLQGAQSLVLRVGVFEDRIDIRCKLGIDPQTMGWAKEWFLDAPPGFAVGSILPRDTTALVRTRIQADKIRAVPSFLRSALIPSGVLKAIHPLLETTDLDKDLLSYIRGNIAFAFLGLAEGAAPGKILTARRFSDGLPLLEAALIFDVHKSEEFWGRFTKLTEFAQKSGYQLTAAKPAGKATLVTKLVHEKNGEHLAAFLLDNTVIITAGVQAYLGLRDVLEGRSTELSKRIESQLLADVAADSPLLLGIVTTFSRISRELGERGAPPFYLRTLDSIFEAGARIGAEPDGLRFDLEVIQ
ncbi:MAG: hypothetical protein HUU55_08335 [Myxococcales bacterium]|nr:hypothetical protein [Myxococcales bacterium]